MVPWLFRKENNRESSRKDSIPVYNSANLQETKRDAIRVPPMLFGKPGGSGMLPLIYRDSRLENFIETIDRMLVVHLSASFSPDSV